jgi:hypothetical protein
MDLRTRQAPILAVSAYDKPSYGREIQLVGFKPAGAGFTFGS